MAANNNTFQTLLAATLVSSLPTPKGEVIIVSSTETPYDGFKVSIPSMEEQICEQNVQIKPPSLFEDRASSLCSVSIVK